MASVTVKQGEDINRAIKRFKRKVEKEGIMKELKSSQEQKRKRTNTKNKSKILS